MSTNINSAHPQRLVLLMTDDNDAGVDSAERRTLYRVSLVAAGLIVAGLSLGAWEEKQDTRSYLPQMTVAD